MSIVQTAFSIHLKKSKEKMDLIELEQITALSGVVSCLFCRFASLHATCGYAFAKVGSLQKLASLLCS